MVICHVYSDVGNVRKANEDRYTIKITQEGKSTVVISHGLNAEINDDPTNKDLANVEFFAVYDGHGGANVSEFIAKNLHSVLLQKKFLFPLDLKKIYKIFDVAQSILIKHGDKIAAKCGTTALIIIIVTVDEDQYIQTINLGDCRALLCRSKKGRFIELSHDHKPCTATEVERIKVVNESLPVAHVRNPWLDDFCIWRIGDLSVSRSFGDLDNTPHVTHFPEVTKTIKVLKTDIFIIMGCDGIWDVISNEEAVIFVLDLICKRDMSRYRINHGPGKIYDTNPNRIKYNFAQELVNYALAKGGEDNMTAIVIFLHPRIKEVNHLF
jgi:protein phosphatase 2C